jgi:hypothetical protein
LEQNDAQNSSHEISEEEDSSAGHEVDSVSQSTSGSPRSPLDLPSSDRASRRFPANPDAPHARASFASDVATRLSESSAAPSPRVSTSPPDTRQTTQSPGSVVSSDGTTPNQQPDPVAAGPSGSSVPGQAVPPAAAAPRPATRASQGIRQPKQYSDGTVP